MKVFVIFGTRPEAIKMAPIVRQLKKRPALFQTVVCVTAQHRQMLDQVLDLFGIVPDHDLDIMTKGQDLFDVTTRALTGLGRILRREKPDLVLVQGDTTTAFVGSLAAYYLQIPIGHVEAGLRTYDKYNPFPEEKNRHMTGVLADYHFAPTERARANLLKENVAADRIWVTGNTVIDALLIAVGGKNEGRGKEGYWADYFLTRWGMDISSKDRKWILVTGHRRESFGEGFRNICLALKDIAERHPDVSIVYPVHLNPNVRQPVSDILGAMGSVEQGSDFVHKDCAEKNIFLIDPLEYLPFVVLMERAHIILTDSGGIQEEGPSLGKPVLVMRNTTERPEGVEAGTTRLVGTDRAVIVQSVEALLSDSHLYASMATVKNPYGDGRSAERIVNVLDKLSRGVSDESTGCDLKN